MVDSSDSDGGLEEEFSNLDAKDLNLHSIASPSDFYLKLDEELISKMCTDLKIS